MVELILVLARAPWAEQGDIDDHLHIHACLTAQGRIDSAAFDLSTDIWRATRFQPGRDPQESMLVQAGDGWALRLIGDDDEPQIGLTIGILRPGEMVGWHCANGATLWFRIVSVGPDRLCSPFD